MKKMYIEIKTLIKPINLLIGIILGIFIVNKYGLNIFQSWKFEFNAVAIEYLKVIFSMPTVILILFATFFSRFQSAIDYFIRNMRFKYMDVDVRTQQAKDMASDDATSSDANQIEEVRLSKQDVQTIANRVDNLRTENESKQQTIDGLKDLVIELVNRSEFFEFKYLDKMLVLNTKYVLKDLNRFAPITKDSLIRNIFVPEVVKDRVGEQFAIHNALLINGLIEEDGSVVTVSEKGKRYLKFVGLI